MLANERLVYIANCLREQPFISNQELAKRLGVSLSTVQRDIGKLEQRGIVEKQWGGIVPKGYVEYLDRTAELPVQKKGDAQSAQKQHIGQSAARFVQDGMCIFIDSGTTPCAMLEYVAYKPVTILTNSLYLAAHIPAQAKAVVELLPGVVDVNYQITAGVMALRQLKQYRLDAAFFGANGVCGTAVSVLDDQLGMFKQGVMEQAERSYLLADRTKWGKQGSFCYADLTDFTAIITEEEIHENNRSE